MYSSLSLEENKKLAENALNKVAEQLSNNKTVSNEFGIEKIGTFNSN